MVAWIFPVSGDILFQESGHGVTKFVESSVTSVVGDVSVHQPPRTSLLRRRVAVAALVAGPPQTLNTVFHIEPEPGPYRVIVRKKNSRDFSATHCHRQEAQVRWRDAPHDFRLISEFRVYLDELGRELKIQRD